ncbi:MAG: ferrous iron transport protein A [Hahellaceae bacterium]|jgi:ferrous iron transport protein A|nr:ferrous iron transport protein A [Hahellaceae bacterium]
MTLQDIKAGHSYVVKTIASADEALVSKILALGIVPGEKVELMHKAPLGDPMQVKAGSTYVSIRRADGIYVEVDRI